MEVAEQELAVAVAQVHAVTLAVAEVLAAGTLAGVHPFAMTIGGIAVLPDVHEVVLVDVALIVVCPDAGTGGNGAVGHHGTYCNASLTGEQAVTHLTLVIAEETLAAIVGADAAFLAHLSYIVKDATELLVRQPHVRVEDSPAHGKDGEEPPALHALGDEKLLDVVEMGIVAAVDTGDDVEDEALGGYEHIDGLAHHSEALVIAAHPVVVGLQTVKADGHRMDAGPLESLPALGREVQGVGHHTPREAFLIDGASALFDVAAHQRLTARDDDKHLVRIGILGDAVEHAEEVLLGHVATLSLHLTVAATVAALQVAAQGTLPEELLQGVLPANHFLFLPPQLKGQSLLQGQRCRLHDFFFSLTSVVTSYFPPYQWLSPSPTFTALA